MKILSTLASFLTSCNICSAQLGNNVYDASCLRSGESIYVFGGATCVGMCVPSTKVYRAELKDLLNSESTSELSWKETTIEGYKGSGIGLAAINILSENSILYHGGQFADLNEIHLKKIDLKENKVEVISKRPGFLIKTIESKEISSPVNIAVTLLTNDLNSSEVILIGEKTTGKDSKVFVNNNIGIFNIESGSWSTAEFPYISGEHQFSAVHKGCVFIFGNGVYTEEIPDSHKVPYYDKDNRSVIAEYNIGLKYWKTRLTSGDLPTINGSYMFIQKNHLLFLVHDRDDDIGSIHVLNLDTFLWTKFHENGFKSYSGGCLTFYDDTLLHYLGSSNVKGIQSIDTSKWFLKVSNSESSINKPTDEVNFYIIISACGTFFLIIVIVVIYITRRRRTKLKPPKLLNGFVSCDTIDLHDSGNKLKTSGPLSDENSEWLKITELNPEECFNNEISVPQLSVNSPISDGNR